MGDDPSKQDDKFIRELLNDYNGRVHGFKKRRCISDEMFLDLVNSLHTYQLEIQVQ